MHTNSSLSTRIRPQWLSELRRLWPSVPWWVACELVSWQVPVLCLHSSILSPLRLHWVKAACMFRCNLPHALLAEWPGFFTCHCGNTGVKWTPNKSQPAEKVNFGKEISPATPAGIRTRNRLITSPSLYSLTIPTSLISRIKISWRKK